MFEQRLQARRTWRGGQIVLAIWMFAFLYGAVSCAQQADRESIAPLQPLDTVQQQVWAQTHPAGDTAMSAQVSGATPAVSPMTVGPNGTVQFSGFQNAPYVSSKFSNIESSVAADFNQDGKNDVLIFTTESPNSMQLMLGNGDGTFSAGPSQTLYGGVYSACRGVFQATAVDVNHDGYPDVVALCTPYSNFTPYIGQVILLTNNRDGTFSYPVSISAPIVWPYSGSVAGFQIYDVDGDGNPDIVTVGSSTDATSKNPLIKIDTFFGSSSGSYTQRPFSESSLAFHGVYTIVQFGAPMRIVAAAGTPYVYLDVNASLYIAKLQTDGTVPLSTATVMSLGSHSSTTAKEVFIDFADLNGDGINDFILNDEDGYAYVALGQSATAFGPLHAATPGRFPNPGSVFYPADVDGDGCTDLIGAGRSYLETYSGNCDGTFNMPASTNIMGLGRFSNDNNYSFIQSVGPMVADWNGDGKLDVVSPDSYSGALSFYRGLGNGSFAGNRALSIPASSSAATHTLTTLSTPDLNGDGLSDVVVYSSFAGKVFAGINQGNGTFNYTPINKVPNIFNIAPVKADFNRDGKEDIVQVSYDSNGNLHFWVSYSNGDGSFKNVALPTLANTYRGAVVLTGDINGDNWPDLVIGVADAYCTPTAFGGGCGFITYLNDGKGNLLPGQFVPTGGSSVSGYPYSLTVADVDGDGRDDVFVSRVAGSQSLTDVLFYRSPADSNYNNIQPVTLLSSASFTPFTYAMTTGDLRTIGNNDLVLSTSAGVYKVLNDGYGNFSTPVQVDTQGYPAISVFDINQDGVPDILGFAGGQSNRLGLNLLLGYGDSTFAAPVSYYTFPSSYPGFIVNVNGDNNPSVFLNAGGGSYGTIVLPNNASSRITLSAAAKSVPAGNSVTLSVQLLSSVSGQGAPSGTVTFYDGGNILGNSLLNATGLATFATPGLTSGPHVYSAIYSGDAIFGSNLFSNSVTVTTTAVSPAFSMSSPGFMLTLGQNASTSAVLNFAANSTFSGPVSLTCSGLPSNVFCSFSSATVNLTSGGSATSTLKLSSGSATASNRQDGGLILGGVVSAALLLLPFQRRKFASILCFVVLSVLFLGSVGCGGAGPAVAPGAYIVTVNASAQGVSVPAQTVSFVVNVTR